MKLFTVEFSPVSCYQCPLRPQYLPQHPIYKLPQVQKEPLLTDIVQHVSLEITNKICVYWSPYHGVCQ